MKTAIFYASRKGYVLECAAALQKGLEGSVELVDVAKNRRPELSGYDGVIIGGSIRASQLNRAVKRFGAHYNQQIQEKPPLGLFLCGLEKKQQEAYFRQEYPPALLEKAAVTGWFGGRIDLSQHGLPVRWLLKRIMRAKNQEIREKIEDQQPEAVQEFISRFNTALAAK